MLKIKNRMVRTLLGSVGLSLGLAFTAHTAQAADPVKIGFVVKQPEEAWFQDEWKFAEQAAKAKGFTLVKIGATDGQQVLTAINNLGAQHAQGFIICVPDVKLGPAVIAAAKQNDLKVLTVDDRLVDGNGKPITTVPHMGISAYKIGEQVGDSISAEMKKRGWDPKTVGAIRISYDQLPTAKDRTDGAVASLTKNGFPSANILNAPQQKTDTEAAFNAANIVITKNPQFKHWITFGLNDEAVLGAVRATEQAGVKADNVIGVGIGGSNAAMDEFAKKDTTGFYGTVLISPKRHGYETSTLMYDWIKDGKEPPMLTQTTGAFMNRKNIKDVRKEMGLDD